MHRWSRYVLVAVGVMTLVAGAVPAGADHDTRPHTQNMRAAGHSPHASTFLGLPDGQRHVNSDIAFWGNLAFHGNYDGWRVIDITDADTPTELAHPSCNGDQGDIVVWDNVLVRSWNSPKTTDRTCLGQTVPAGWEGVHVFDITDPVNPSLEASVELPCGSHTVTLVPDLGKGRVIVYSNVSSGCTKDGVALGNAMDIIEVPLDNLAGANRLGDEPIIGGTLGSNNGCHDAGVILGDVNLLACASGHAANVFSIGAPHGGTLEDPEFLYNVEEQDAFGNKVGVGGRWHSAAFTWDGEVLILGWEPGGGAAAECESTDPAIKKSMFFYDAETGAKLGQWTLPRPQDGPGENCTIHNYNILPFADRYIAVSGNYQAGTWVTEFTNPASPTTVAWSDPPPLSPPDLGGAWSSYSYNGKVYESEITKGLNVFIVTDKQVKGARKLPHLNPQTQEFSL